MQRRLAQIDESIAQHEIVLRVERPWEAAMTSNLKEARLRQDGSSGCDLRRMQNIHEIIDTEKAIKEAAVRHRAAYDLPPRRPQMFPDRDPRSLLSRRKHQ
jgi:hypothetical protein